MQSMPDVNGLIQMNGRVLADTNVLIALFAGDPDIVEHLNQQREVFLCVPVLGELGMVLWLPFALSRTWRGSIN